jgi:hypothetical protein
MPVMEGLAARAPASHRRAAPAGTLAEGARHHHYLSMRLGAGPGGHGRWIAGPACCLAIAAIASGCGGNAGTRPQSSVGADGALTAADRRAESLVTRIAQIMAADAGGVAECDPDEPACISRQASSMAQDARVEERVIARAAGARGLSPCMAPVLRGFRAELRAIERLGQDQAGMMAQAVATADLARLGRIARRVAALARACGSPAIASAALSLH